MDGSITEVQRTERSGVPVLWAPGEGSCVGALLVRSGKVDETLRTSGVNHLVEHLSLFPLGRQVYSYNGRVEEAITLFYAEGTPEEVAGFLQETAGHLAALPLDRLEVERRVLLTEAEGRTPGVEARLLSLRFGPRGYGMLNQGELGLGWLGPDELTAWAAERFTTGNAVAWMSAEPPEDLELALPAGPAWPAPAPEPIPQLVLPAQVDQGTGGVALSLLVDRSIAITTALALAAERAHDRLRLDAGLSYAVYGGYVRLDADSAHAILQADCKDHNAARVRDELLGVLDDLASSGPTEEELERDLAAYRRSREDPASTFGMLDWFAREQLLGGGKTSNAELVAEREALTADEVREAVAEAVASLLVLVPDGTGARDAHRFADYDTTTTTGIEGRQFTSAQEGVAWEHQHVLTVGERGVMMVGRTDDEPMTVLFDGCAAVIRLLSGGVRIVDAGGGWIGVDPHAYPDGREALEAVEAALDDPDLVVPLTDRERELEPVIAEQLGPYVSLVTREIDALESLLARDETIVRLATATWGDRRVLVVVSDRRVLLASVAYESLIDLRREDVTAATKGLLRRKRLELTVPDGTYELSDVRPPGTLETLALDLR